MDRYDFATLSYYGRISFICTNFSFAENLIEELKKTNPKLDIYTRKLPSGENYWLQLSDFAKEFQERDILWWIIKQLCANGWEPLGSGQNPDGSDPCPSYNFRRRWTS
jgi:hypothetical protein